MKEMKIAFWVVVWFFVFLVAGSAFLVMALVMPSLPLAMPDLLTVPGVIVIGAVLAIAVSLIALAIDREKH